MIIIEDGIVYEVSDDESVKTYIDRNIILGPIKAQTSLNLRWCHTRVITTPILREK